MALPWKRTCLPVCGLIRHIAALQIPSTRKKHSVPWYQEVVQKPDKTKVQKEDQRSILRNPGIVTVSKLSKEELCQHLAQNVVYREGPLLAINKPQGLSIAGTSEEISLVSILPDLQQLLEIKPELHVVKAAPMESSGLVLLSTCHVTTKRFEDFYSQCRKAKKPFTTFRAITLGVPDPAEGDVKVALKEEDIKDLRLVIPVTDPSRGSLERREVKETRTLYKVLDSADGCSLLQLQPMTAAEIFCKMQCNMATWRCSVHRWYTVHHPVFREQLMVQCTLKFCPILGDHTYGSRVAKILGKDTYIPFDLALPQTQRVEENILRKMHFSSQQMHRMPLHLHLHQLLMPKDPQGRYPAHLQAPPLPFFQRTMELLGLRVQN